MPYKMFNKDLTCRGFKYKVGETYTLPKDKKLGMCENGFHYCEEPLKCLNFYNLLDEKCNLQPIHKVEPLGKIKVDGIKSVTDKIKIGNRLSLHKLIDISSDIITKNRQNVIDLNYVVSIRDYDNLVVGGVPNHTAIVGAYSNIVSDTYQSYIASSGHRSTIFLNGACSRAATNGNFTRIMSTKSYSYIAATGTDTNVISTARNAKVCTCGDSNKIVCGGAYSSVTSNGELNLILLQKQYSTAAVSGDASRVVAKGKHSIIANIGINGMAKGVKGTWITLAEYAYVKADLIPVYVKSFKVDGKRIKENTFYKLENKKLVEVKNEEE